MKVERTSSALPIVVIIVFIIFVILMVLVTILSPKQAKQLATEDLTKCQQNLKVIGTALELYAKDNKDLYPANLADLIISGKMERIPVCLTGVNYYYKPASDFKDYSLYCESKNKSHQIILNLPEFRPGYDRKKGIYAQ